MAGSPWTNQAVSLIVLTEQTTGFSGIFGYSPTVAHGNLIFSLSAAAGTDPYGNAYPQGLNLGTGAITGIDFVVDGANGGVFIYSGTPANGNLIGSWAGQAGTDAYGNTYPQGLNVTMGSISGTTFTGTDFIINSSGEFFYSGTPAAGNLVSSVAPAAGTDAFGNNFLAGPATYDNGSEIATALNAGFVAFYSGSLAGGWSSLSSVSGDGSGNLQVNAAGELQLIGSFDVTINGSDQTSTATGSPQTSGPNGGVFAGHTHDFAGHTHTL